MRKNGKLQASAPPGVPGIHEGVTFFSQRHRGHKGKWFLWSAVASGIPCDTALGKPRKAVPRSPLGSACHRTPKRSRHLILFPCVPWVILKILKFSHAEAKLSEILSKNESSFRQGTKKEDNFVAPHFCLHKKWAFRTQTQAVQRLRPFGHRSAWSLRCRKRRSEQRESVWPVHPGCIPRPLGCLPDRRLKSRH